MLPCELYVVKLLPSIRRQLVLRMLRDGKSQKEIAQVFGVTEATISHYINKRRGRGKKQVERLAERAMRFYKNGLSISKNVCQMCKNLRSSGDLCALHALVDGTKEKDNGECASCFTCCQ